ncbi:MAG: AzlD domain-containing protein [Halodesulfurarchaeum sp.]|nr:AzlD domain-containing protein [Halodesulfurarchaeum sp.]
MTTSYAPTLIWVAIVAIGLLTFAIRVSFIAVFSRVDEIPPRIRTLLRYVPAAVLAGLVFPAFVTVGASGNPELDKLLAGGAAATVAWRTENVLYTLVAGMGSLWVLRWLVL